MKNKQALQMIVDEGIALALQKEAGKKFPHLLGELDKHANASMYYGFTPIKTPTLSPDDIAKSEPYNGREIGPVAEAKNGERPVWSPAERIAMLRTYAENDMHSLQQPVQVFYKKPFPGSGDRKQAREGHFGLDILGTSRPIGEALVIQSACATLRDEGFTDLIVEINSIGDKDAMAKHERELGLYFKKHAQSLEQNFRSAFKGSLFDILTTNEAGCEIFRESAPKSVSYLGEAGRKHFMEVLDYLEMLDIPYRINHGLLGNRGFASHVVFEIKNAGPDIETTLAVGSRYNSLSKKIGFKKELPAVGATIFFKKNGTDEAFRAITNPKFYFIQFGSDARLRSMKLIEMLRKERIAVYHGLTQDKLLPQMMAAEELKVPFVIIMGQKEALEGTVVVRDVNSRAQETVGMNELVGYLKKLK